MRGVPIGQAPPVSRELPRPGVYRHFKGGQYEVLEVARHSETEEVLVVYRSLDDPSSTWVRPLDMFTSVVEGPAGSLSRCELMSPTDSTKRVGIIGKLARLFDYVDRRLGAARAARSASLMRQ